MWLAKAGFGAFKTAFDYTPLIAAARAHGMITTVHTGGSSIPGSGAITGDHLLALKPHVSFHVNGGPTAMPDRDFERDLAKATSPCRSARPAICAPRSCARRSPRRLGAFDRLIVATDTPTGSGIMPLGMLYTIAHLASLAGIAPERCIAAATGSNARVYRLERGLLAAGQGADIVLIDAPDGGTQDNALAAIKQWRHRGGRRGDHRRRAALRRAQPQHAGDDAENSRRAMPDHARLFWPVTMGLQA